MHHTELTGAVSQWLRITALIACSHIEALDKVSALERTVNRGCSGGPLQQLTWVLSPLCTSSGTSECQNAHQTITWKAKSLFCSKKAIRKHSKLGGGGGRDCVQCLEISCLQEVPTVYAQWEDTCNRAPMGFMLALYMYVCVCIPNIRGAVVRTMLCCTYREDEHAD